MHVDSLTVSPISARGQERLARLRATIQHQFTTTSMTTTSVPTDGTRRATPHQQQHQQQQNPRARIRQRIELAARMTSDEIFFREFGSAKQLIAVDFDLARPASPPPQLRVDAMHQQQQQRQQQPPSSTAALQQRVPLQPSVVQHGAAAAASSHTSIQPSHRAPSRGEVPSHGRAASMAQPALAGSSAAAMRIQAALDRIQSRSQQLAERRAASASATASTQHAPAAFVSQLQRPSRIVTPKKASLKRQRAPDEPPSAEKVVMPPPAQKPRLLTDVTSTFNNRSFSNVAQARGSNSNNNSSSSTNDVASRSSSSSGHVGTSRASSFVASPVRKATGFSRVAMLQRPSPSKFRATPSLFRQHQSATYR